MADSHKLNNEESSGNGALRRSKRNKYHLNLKDVLKTGTDAHRDYSPPTKKWATRRPEPAAIAEQIKIGKASPSKRNSKKEETTTTINIVEKPEVKEAKESLKPEETIEKKQNDEEELTTVVQEEKIERENASQETKHGNEETDQPQIGSSSNIQHQSIFTEFVQKPDIQLPEKILEEDEYVNVDNVKKTQEPLIDTNVATCSSTSLPMFSPALPVDEQIKRKRKVPLRHLDYTNGESDLDEELMVRDVKMEYTSSNDGNKMVDVHSCPKCPAIFESRVGLTNHHKLHGSKKEFPCELCDFSCTNKKTMRQHRRVHGINRKHRKFTKSNDDNKKPKDDGNDETTKLNVQIQVEETNSSNNEATNETRPKMKFEIFHEEEANEEDIRINLDEDDNLFGENIQQSKTSGEAVKVDEMPILEQQQTETMPTIQSTSSGRNKRTVVKAEPDEHDYALSSANLRGYYKKGSRIYNRNTVKCPHCPFRTQSKVRLEPHIAGHERSIGYVCSICQFKSESSGILHRHCNLHKNEAYKWPPDYLGTSSGQTGGPGVNEREEEEKLVEEAMGIGEAEIFEEEEKKEEERKHWKVERGEEEECSPLLLRIKSDYKEKKDGATKWLINGEMFSKLVQKIGSSSVCKFPCLRCHRLFRSKAKLVLHKLRRHSIGKQRKLVISELFAERIYWKEGNRYDKSAEKMNIPSSKIEIRAAPNEISSKFHCRNCPYETDQIFRLQKHENKHLVKAEHQCTFCTFSCRSMEILTQHLRLHDNSNSATVDSNDNSKCGSSVQEDETSSQNSTINQQNLPIEPPPVKKPVPYRRNETHYCPYCPYTSKHGCDIRAHYKMHEVRRKHICSTCTYSTMRQNALLAHEKLHQTGGNACTEECRRIKIILQRIKNDGHQQLGKFAILGEHLQFIKNKNVHFYRCAHKKCGAEFLFRSSLFQHARHHLKNEWAGSRKLICSCGFATNLEGRMRQHEAMHVRKGNEEKNVRSVLGVFNCKECPYSTANYAKFWNHRQKHKKTSKFACSECSFSSGSLLCYNEHMELHNSGREGTSQMKPAPIIRNIKPAEEEKEAQHLDETTFKKETYEHISSVIPAQMKSAGMLGKPPKENDSGSTSSKNSSTHSKMKACTECPYRTNDHILLKLHSEMHRRGRTRPFQCNLCSFGCFSAESLHIHLSLHASTVNRNGESLMKQQTNSSTNAASNSYQCSQCNFKCVELDALLVHRKEHVQLLQQRLMTIIKRSANDQNNHQNVGGINGGGSGGGFKDKMKMMRTAKQDKQHYCSKCGFRCESVQAFVLHWEHHKSDGDKCRQGIFRCSICDYSSDTKNVVIFHEENHHLDIPLVALCQKKV